jgi:hypothetical protein
MNEKIFYPCVCDYQDLEDFICGSNEQQQQTIPYYPPTWIITWPQTYPPTYPTSDPFYKTTDNTGAVTDYHNYTTCSYSVSPKETVFPSGDKFIFYA